jgi:uncharacterized protein YndB with AHSA1/START domain
MDKGHVAHATTTIDASPSEVWDALVSPEKIEKYMFGAKVASEWKKGSPISWRGEWKGKPYEDKGEVLDVEPERRLRYSHFSPLEGTPDKPASYHTVTIELSPKGRQTLVALSQDNNATAEAQKHSEQNWKMMLDGLKKVVEH